MIATIAQISMGAIALLICLWGYWQAIKMGIVNQKYHLNGSTGMVVRTIKRREFLQAIKCSLIILSGCYVIYWLKHQRNGMDNADVVILLRSFSFTLIAFIIALNTIWDAIDRWNVSDLHMREHERLRTQKRKTDPTPGEPLAEPDLQHLEVTIKAKDTEQQ